MSNLKLYIKDKVFKEFSGRCFWDDREKYKTLNHSNLEGLAFLLDLIKNEGFVPLSSEGLMKRRLEVLTDKYSAEIRNAWWDYEFTTGDVIFNHPDGHFKIVPDGYKIIFNNLFLGLRNNVYRLYDMLSSDTSKGGFIISEEFYNNLEGEEFTLKEIEKYGLRNKLLDEREAKNHPVWRALARGNSSLLHGYVDSVFDYLKKSTQKEKAKAMLVSASCADCIKVISGYFLSIDGPVNDSASYVVGSCMGSPLRFIGVKPEG